MDIYRDLGYGVLCWDTPGVGDSTGRFGHDTRLDERASILVAAIDLLLTEPDVDLQMIGVWGISQAGYVIPLASLQTDAIAFMIMNSCPAADTIVQGAYLAGQLVECAGYSEEEARQIETWSIGFDYARTYDEHLANVVPLNESDILHSLGIHISVESETRWIPEDPERWIFFNSIEVIEKTTVPVLAFFGELDRQVNPIRGVPSTGPRLREPATRTTGPNSSPAPITTSSCARWGACRSGAFAQRTPGCDMCRSASR